MWRLSGFGVCAAVACMAAVSSADDFDETFRHWGDADHMGTHGVLGASGLHTHDEQDRLGAGVSASLGGQGVAFSYWPDTPRTFRFVAFGALGAMTSGEVTSFDGAIGSELMIGYRAVLPHFTGDRPWPRDELVARVGVGFHVTGNHLVYSSALEAPRLELGYRRASWFGGRRKDTRFRRHSYVMELRAVATLLALGSYELSLYQRDLDAAPAWGGQLDLVGVVPEVNLSYLRVLSDLEVPVDRVEARGCLKVGPTTWGRHPYIVCAQWRLQYAVEDAAALDGVSLRGGLSFGFSG